VKTIPLLQSETTILLDGGMGTLLQARGILKPGDAPDLLVLTHPAEVEAIHAAYAAAGSRILNTDTFGASAIKLAKSGCTPEQVIPAAVACARRAAQKTGAWVALDIGPLGELLEPAGTFGFEQAVSEFARMVKAGAQAGADLVVLETFTDLYELKAALLAVKENCDLPVLASMSFEARGRTFTGCSPESFAATARALGADALGINCSLGPQEIFPIAKRLCAALPGDFPVFIKPNAGLPRADGSGYDITPQRFAMQMKPYRELGLFAAGGCCGTTPETIRMLGSAMAGCRVGREKTPPHSWLCTPTSCVNVTGITVVGERINPTGKKRFQQAIREGDTDYILAQGLAQAEAGAAVLDVNVGVPDTDEAANLCATVKALQSVLDTPLQLDSTKPEALERALRIYNGRPIVNSVNGEQKSLDTILPLCKKYGAAIVGLTLDEHGIPKTSGARFAIARRIVAAAEAAGIAREDIYIDCLTLTASAQQEDVTETLTALRRCKQELGVRTVLGVSNISFGLPCRVFLNTTFLAMAMTAGLDLAILNPASEEMMAAVCAYRVLTNMDRQSAAYIARYQNYSPASANAAPSASQKGLPGTGSALPKTADAALAGAVEKGLKKEAVDATRALLESRAPLSIIDETLIPALDVVGTKYENGVLFLPQLLQAAAAAQSAFAVLKDAIAQSGTPGESKGTVVVATVKGDVHDIGKNIVRVILENYGFTVVDLGRDVPPETVVQAVAEHSARLCGLSALMTTTLPAMADTIALLHQKQPQCKVMVGGAVLTAEYAAHIGADYYAENAKQSADIARKIFNT
jgi:5-methyltetrahydrofolate--homocysteine methyltransferase